METTVSQLGDRFRSSGNADIFFFYGCGDHRDLHSFPTRRSSDLYAKTRAVRYIDGGGRAAARGTIEAFAQLGFAEVPHKGPLVGTLTVPGSVASWTMAHAAYGRLPLKRCLENAIGHAREGFPVGERLAHWRQQARPELAKSPEAAAIFLKDEGPTLRQPELARTLEAIAGDGWYGFYDGEVARELVRYSQSAGG